jgi:hypothetical protein
MTNDVTILPRVKLSQKRLMCSTCPFQDECWQTINNESQLVVKVKLEDDELLHGAITRTITSIID